MQQGHILSQDPRSELIRYAKFNIALSKNTLNRLETINLYQPIFIDNERLFCGSALYFDIMAMKHQNGYLSQYGSKNEEYLKGFAYRDQPNSIFCENPLLFSGTANGLIKTWKLKNESWESIDTINAHLDSIMSLSYTDDLLFSGTYEGIIKAWKLEDANWKCIQLLDEGAAQMRPVFYKSMLFGGCNDGKIKIFQWRKDVSLWSDPVILNGHTQYVLTLFYDPKRQLLFSGSADQTIKIWQCQKDQWSCLQTLVGHEGKVSCLFYKNGMLFSGSKDKTIKIWKCEKNLWSCVQTLKAESRVARILYENGNLIYGTLTYERMMTTQIYGVR